MGCLQGPLSSWCWSPAATSKLAMLGVRLVWRVAGDQLRYLVTVSPPHHTPPQHRQLRCRGRRPTPTTQRPLQAAHLRRDQP
ncbi:hypothetical protein ABFA25_10975 [Mycobacterium lepromatosis]|uniref:hypothetical protein n=1 Tax=Mycobacterium lepromatosis TaxID=480418 RepID=UPI003D801A47